MRYVFFIILILFSLHVSGQSIKGISATYSVKGIEDSSRSTINNLVFRDNPHFLEELASVTFTLNANAKSSYFQVTHTPRKSIKENLSYWIGAGTDGVWQDSIASYIEYPKNPVDKEDFIMQSLKGEVWSITDESKMIEGFECYKATGITKTVTPQGKEFIKSTTAWFCPEIPFSFGPLKFGGLPGLIMEVQTDNYILGIQKLVFNDKIQIKSLPDLDIITEANHQKKFSEWRERLKR